MSISLRQPYDFLFALIILSDDVAGMMSAAQSALYGARIPNDTLDPQRNVLELYLHNPRQRNLTMVVDNIKVMLSKLQCLELSYDVTPRKQPRSIQDALQTLTTPEIFTFLSQIEVDLNNKLFLRSLDQTPLPISRILTLQLLYKVQGFSGSEVSYEYLDDAEFVQEYYLSEYEKGKLDTYVSDRLMDDEDTVRTILSRDPLALAFISERLKNTREIAMLAIDQDPHATLLVGHILSEDIDFLVPIFQRLGRMYTQGTLDPGLLPLLWYFDMFEVIERGDLHDDIDVMSLCVASDGILLFEASPRLKDTEQVVMTAVSRNGRVLAFASDRLRNNLAIAIMAVKQNWRAIYAVGERSQRYVLYTVLFMASFLFTTEATTALSQLWDHT